MYSLGFFKPVCILPKFPKKSPFIPILSSTFFFFAVFLPSLVYTCEYAGQSTLDTRRSFPSLYPRTHAQWRSPGQISTEKGLRETVHLMPARRFRRLGCRFMKRGPVPSARLNRTSPLISLERVRHRRDTPLFAQRIEMTYEV